jgi:hypothetical protein
MIPPEERDNIIRSGTKALESSMTVHSHGVQPASPRLAARRVTNIVCSVVNGAQKGVSGCFIGKRVRRIFSGAPALRRVPLPKGSGEGSDGGAGEGTAEGAGGEAGRAEASASQVADPNFQDGPAHNMPIKEVKKNGSRHAKVKPGAGGKGKKAA